MVVKTKSLGTRSTTYPSFLSRGIGLGRIFNRIACIVAQRPALPKSQPRGEGPAASGVVSEIPVSQPLSKRDHFDLTRDR
jgi:hypothetical protein